jgi:hypothetical protein
MGLSVHCLSPELQRPARAGKVGASGPQAHLLRGLSAFHCSRAQAFALLPLARTEWEAYIGLARSTDFIGRAANARIAFDRHVTAHVTPPDATTPTGRSPPGDRAVETSSGRRAAGLLATWQG